MIVACTSRGRSTDYHRSLTPVIWGVSVHRHISARRESSAMANHAPRYFASYCDSGLYAEKANILNVFGHILTLLDFVTF
jgi:hypothetical protein